ncbi:MAG: hypothetical protein IPM51_17440 [Sphingobacteriaceae bacterium]|nr:hypothetical protein [Sphingobacteriaceae bacterium]
MKNYILVMVIVLLGSCNNDKKTSNCPETPTVKENPFPEKIKFPSLDSLTVFANLYHYNDSAPVIVLCHQARYNKFEYSGIAPKLHKLGYNCLAIDQRSGGGIVESINETNKEALKLNKAVDFLDAEQDIIAAVEFAAKKYKQNVILWGSSYSSVLSLYTAIDHKNVRAVIAFSPGDYFQKEKGSLTEKIKTFEKPMLVTSSKEEAPELSAMLKDKKLGVNQIQFIPDSIGHHGSRALWESSNNNEEYWKAILNFLESLKN